MRDRPEHWKDSGDCAAYIGIMSIKVLFIGGAGVISSACTELASSRGIKLYLLRRGLSDRPVPAEVRTINGDIRNIDDARNSLGKLEFDVVVDWIAFTAEHVKTDLELFRDRTRQYIFISSASAYQTPPTSLPVVESTPLRNPFWEYSRHKIACEELLMAEYRDNGFPATIVRPSHTYDRTMLPFDGGYTVIDRMRRGKPVIVHGDGTSLWTITHHRDFAKGFVGLLGNARAIGQAYHITTDEFNAWDQIFRIYAQAAGANAQLVHVPSEVIAAYDARWGAGLLGDKSHSLIFDNSKIKQAVPGFSATIPLSDGARETIEWYDADPQRHRVNAEMDAVMDRIVEGRERALPLT